MTTFRDDPFSPISRPTPVALPELPDEEEARLLEAEASTEEIASSERSTQEANGDDLDDLFRGISPDAPDIATDDLVRIDEEDVFGPGGEDMSDITEVSDEDIIGDDIEEPISPPQPKHRIIRKFKRTSKQYPPLTGMTGLRG